MKLIIEIPDEAVKTDNIANDFITYFECCTPKLFETLKNGTPLPKGHGDLIDSTKLRYKVDEDGRILITSETIIEADKGSDNE